jgi:hypothetical protein
MQTLMQASGSWRVSRSFLWYANASRLGGMLFARIAKRLPNPENEAVNRYSGCGWTDEIERRALDDVFNGHRRSI